MIIADTDILSAFAKIERLPLLYSFFRVSRMYTSQGVVQEIEWSANQKFAFALDVLAQISMGRIAVEKLSPAELEFERSLPISLGKGEREIMAIARYRDWLILTNERRVDYWCKQYNIPVVLLPNILRNLWMTGTITKGEVRQIMTELASKDGMKFSPTVLQTIFSEG